MFSLGLAVMNKVIILLDGEELKFSQFKPWWYKYLVFTLLLIAKIPLTNKNLYLGMLDKKIMLIFCLLETIFRLPPTPPPFIFKSSKMSSFFLSNFQRNRAHFSGFEDNFYFAAPLAPSVSTRQIMSIIF